MQPSNFTIDVGLQERMDDLLRRLEELPPGSQVRLVVPGDAIALRGLEDYNLLNDVKKRRQLRLTIASPESTLIGLARIQGFEVEDVVEVDPQESTADLLTRLEKLAPGARLRIQVPMGAQALQQLDDFVTLKDLSKRRQFQINVASPDRKVAGLAKMNGFDSDPGGGRGRRAPVPTETADDEVVPWGGGRRGTASPATPAVPPAATAAFPGLDDLSAPPAPAPAAPPATPTPAEAPAMSYDQWISSGGSAIPDTPAATTGAAATPAARAPETDVFRPAAPNNGAANEPVEPAGGRETRPGTAATEGRAWNDVTQPAGGEANILGSTATPAGRRAAQLPSTDTAPPAADGQGRNGHDRDAFAATAAVAGGAALGATAATVTPEVATPLPRPRPTRVATLPPPEAEPEPFSVVDTEEAARPRRRWTGLAVLLGVLLILLALGTIVVLNLTPPTTTATVTLVPRTSAPFGPMKVVVPVLIAGNTGARPAGLAAPAPQITDTTTLSPTVPATDSNPATGAPSGPVAPDSETAQPVQADKIVTTLQASGTLATTGQKTVPNHSAVGAIDFTNSGASPVVVPGNTKLTATNGKTFHTVGTITVPATDFLGRTFGTARADVQADEPGPDSNGAVIAGSYASAVFTTVVSPRGGDTMQVAIVADADRDNLLKQLKSDIDARASKELLTKVGAAGPDMVPLTCTMVLPADISATQYTFDPQPGADAKEIHGVMTATVSVYAFHMDVAKHQAMLAIQNAAPPDLPVQATIDLASIQVAPLTLSPGSTCNGPRVEYTTQVQAQLVYTFPTGTQIQDNVRKLIAGKAPADAKAAVLASQWGPYLDQVNINLATSSALFDNRPATQRALVPTTASDIQVRVNTAGSLSGAPAIGGGGTDGSPPLSPAPTGTEAAPPGLPPTAEPK